MQPPVRLKHCLLAGGRVGQPSADRIHVAQYHFGGLLLRVDVGAHEPGEQGGLGHIVAQTWVKAPA